MTSSMPHDLPELVLMVFLLGLRHGMDPDHLATIDGLTRFNSGRRPRVARWSGFLFSLGHGVVVTLIAWLVATTLHDGTAPAWLERLGAWISIAFLLALAALNVVAVVRTPADRVVRTAGLKSRWLGGLCENSHPAVIAAIGAVFALSFDTFSQAALFSLTASHVAGSLFAVALGLVFMAGMMATDGVNGAWVARLLERADLRALVASRVMGLSIGVLGISIASLGILRLARPQVAAALDRAQLPLGIGVMLIVLASFAVAVRLARPRMA